MTSKKRSSPTVDENAELDSAATALVQLWLTLSSGWQLRRRLPDTFIDYEIERIESGEPTGKVFYVQQKAHRSVVPNGLIVTQVMETKHLRYYATTHIPVFIIVVDVTAKVGYWVFVQEWLDKLPNADRLNDQETLTVTVPVANRLDDIPALLSAFRRAVTYMREKFPGTIEAAINSEIARLTAIDPRFDIKLDVVDSKKHYHFTPRELVPIRLKIAGNQTEPLRELMEYGRPLDLPSGTVEFDNFPLLDAIKPVGSLAALKLSAVLSQRCDLEFWVDEQSDAPRVHLVGPITVGTAGMLYLGGQESLPLNVEIKTPPLQLKRPSQGTMTVSWDWSAWSGIELLNLPYFEALLSLSQAATEGKTIRHRFSFQGGHLTSGILGKPNGDSPFAAPALLLKTLDKARKLAKALNVNPSLPPVTALTEEDFRDITFAHAILLEGGYSITGTGISVSLTLNSLEKTALEALSQHGISGALRMEHPSQKGRIFGTEIPLGRLEYILNPADTAVNKDALAKVVTGISDELDVEVVGIGRATYSVRQML